ncbi:CpaF family protein [Planomonospora parontospora]|uniref:CpaF family protein n=1 Tax=Planomonospora parontospora TaxID=58119 RepID=UPI001670320D|nr:CpaF family protein [Planomonospora parontospora]GGL47017.1 type II secretion system protein E [Planomonospora parontospora subsp. antibiotica]GII19915.1 type II secretion system protein E [Planomonospora parontospora subsp. antibiotica]
MGLGDRIARRQAAGAPQTGHPADHRAGHRTGHRADPGPRNGRDGTGTPAQAQAGPEDPLAQVRRRAHQALLDVLGPQMYADMGDDDDLRRRVRETIGEVLAAEETPLTAADRARVAAEVADDILGHGPLEPLLRDPDVTEIMVNGPGLVFVERAGRIEEVGARFTDDAHLRRVIDRIVSRVGRHVDEASPMVDARLPDGSRVNAVVAPIALDGSLLTIRKFSADPYTVDDLIAFGTFTRPVAQVLEACVRGRLDMVISGGTGSGKTTTLNVLSGFVPAGDRIVTIEDAAELQLRQKHVLRLESRPANTEGRGEVTIRDLVRNALRMRPDRIVVGEVRDGAALDMLQAMNTGHDGSLTTVHANTPRDTLARLETMVLMAGVDLPARAIREQIASAVDVIVQVTRMKDGVRRITHVTEVTGMEGDIITLQDIFAFDYRAGIDETGRYRGTLVPTGLRPSFLDEIAKAGVTIPPGLFGGAR